MAISWTDVVNIAPNLASITNAAQTAYLAAADIIVDADAWGSYADLGKTYLCAHMASIRDNTAMVTSESVGPLSRSYMNLGKGDSDLALTTFGMMYQRLMKIAIGPPVLVP